MSDAAFPGTASLEVTWLVVFTFNPGVVATRMKATVQTSSTATVAPVRLTVVDPGTAVTTPAPQSRIWTTGSAATWRPAGRLSVHPTPVSVAVVVVGSPGSKF